jgi:hypothetical protein
VATGNVLSTLAQTDRRLAPDVRVMPHQDEWTLADYPATAALLRRGGAFHVDAENAKADAAERALLQRFGRTQVLSAAAGVHLLELYGDEATPPMAWAVPVLRLLVREAVAAPTTAAPSDG